MGSGPSCGTDSPFDLGRPLPFSIVALWELRLTVQGFPFPNLTPERVMAAESACLQQDPNVGFHLHHQRREAPLEGENWTPPLFMAGGASISPGAQNSRCGSQSKRAQPAPCPHPDAVSPSALALSLCSSFPASGSSVCAPSRGWKIGESALGAWLSPDGEPAFLWDLEAASPGAPGWGDFIRPAKRS